MIEAGPQANPIAVSASMPARHRGCRGVGRRGGGDDLTEARFDPCQSSHVIFGGSAIGSGRRSAHRLELREDFRAAIGLLANAFAGVIFDLQREPVGCGIRSVAGSDLEI